MQVRQIMKLQCLKPFSWHPHLTPIFSVAQEPALIIAGAVVQVCAYNVSQKQQGQCSIVFHCVFGFLNILKVIELTFIQIELTQENGRSAEVAARKLTESEFQNFQTRKYESTLAPRVGVGWRPVWWKPAWAEIYGNILQCVDR